MIFFTVRCAVAEYLTEYPHPQPKCVGVAIIAAGILYFLSISLQFSACVRERKTAIMSAMSFTF